MLKLDRELGILRVTKTNKNIPLTLKEVNVLLTLIDNKYHPLAELKEAVWGQSGQNYRTTVLRVLIYRLKKKTKLKIKSKYEFGYILLDKIRERKINNG